MREARRWVRDPTVLWRWTAGGALVLPQDAAEPASLNGPAAAIWEVLDRPRSLEETLGALSSAFNIDEEQIRASVLDALTQMVQLGAVTEIGPEEPNDGRQGHGH